MTQTDLENFALFALAGTFAYLWYRSRSYSNGFSNANWTPSKVWKIPVE